MFCLRGIQTFGLAVVLAASCTSSIAQVVDSGEPLPEPYVRALNAWQKKVKYAAKIVGGNKAKAERHPWQVALVIPGISDNLYALFCGGVLIAPEWVLTSAHCVRGLSGAQVEVLYGTTHLRMGGRRETVVAIHPNPKYVARPRASDLALLKLSSTVSAQQIELIAEDDEPGVLSGSTTLTVAGWGNIYEHGIRSVQLMEVEVPSVTLQECGRQEAHPGKLTDSMLCAGFPDGKRDACEGDSGGPAVVWAGNDARLAAVVSWGDGCGDPMKYGVYARVAVHAEWIRKVKEQ